MWPSLPQPRSCSRRVGGTIAIWPPTIDSPCSWIHRSVHGKFFQSWTEHLNKNLWEDSERLRRNCVQLMHSFVVCQQQQLRTRVSPYCVATNSFGAFSWDATQWLFTTVSMANLCSWLFLLGPAPFAVCFASLLDDETHIWLGDLRFAFCVVVFAFVFLFVDLPCYMTTGVNVDFISNCFFTCKDRALERDRPYQRKKKNLTSVVRWIHCFSALEEVNLFFTLRVSSTVMVDIEEVICLLKKDEKGKVWRKLVQTNLSWGGVRQFCSEGFTSVS